MLLLNLSLKRIKRSNTITASATIKLLIGLRNPGAAYSQTRHNVGAWFVEALANQNGVVFKTDKKLRGECANIQLNGQSVLLFLPLSFMNLNGEDVRAVCQFYRIFPHEILVAHDELDLKPGDARLKTAGGHGGHNGLRDVISQLGSPNFHRLRIGIGHPGHRELVSDYVLSKPSPSDRQCIHESIDRALKVVSTVVTGQMAQAMNLLNRGNHGI